VLNAPSAIGADSNEVELIDRQGEIVQHWSGSKDLVATNLVHWLQQATQTDDPAP